MQSLLSYLFSNSTYSNKIGRFIRDNIDNLERISTKIMCAELNIVPSTITKFAQKLGYDGLKELKSALSVELEKRITISDEVINKSFVSQMNFIARQQEKINACWEQIALHGNVKIIALGASKAIAEMFAYRLRKQQIDVSISNVEYEVNSWIKTAMQRPSVFILISVSMKPNYDFVKLVLEEQHIKDSLWVFTSRDSSFLKSVDDDKIINILESNEIQDGHEISHILGLEFLIWKITNVPKEDGKDPILKSA